MMNNMRDIMNLVESINLDEAGIFNRLANKGMAALGNKKAQGKVSKDYLTQRLKNNYYRWLGRTNKEGTLADLQEFLQKVNFTNSQINQFTKPVISYIEQNPNRSQEQNSNNENQTQAEETNESILNEISANDFILSRNEVDSIMDAASAYAFENGLYNTNSTSNSNSETNNSSNNQQNNKTSNTGSITRVNLFPQPVLNTVNDLGVSNRDIPEMFDYAKNVKFDQIDQEVKDNLAKIGYALLKYNKTGLQ